MTKPLKILLINKLYHPVTGGVERVVQQIAEGLRDRADIKMLACQKKGPTARETINGVDVIKAGSLGMAFSMPVSLPFFRWFNRLKKDRDIIHIHMPFPLADMAVALFGFKGKVALWWHSDVVKQKKLLFFYRPFLKRLLRRADLIVAATQGHIDGSDYLPAYREKCVIIPYAVTPALLDASAAAAATIRPPDAVTRFLFVGRLVYYKGCDVLLEAFARVTGAALTIIGEGPLEAELRQQAQRLGIGGRITWKARLSDAELAREFAGCDVFVLPSVAKSEAFGLVQIEAMAYGKPCINTNLPGGVPYVSIDGVTGLTVPPSDAKALAAAMQRLADDADLREAYGRAAYARARAEYSIDTMLSRTLAAYEKLAQHD